MGPNERVVPRRTNVRKEGRKVKRDTYESWSLAASFTLKLIGVLGILFVPVFWAVTGRIELAFLPFFGTLAGVGQGLDVLKEISQQKIDRAEEEKKGGEQSEQP